MYHLEDAAGLQACALAARLCSAPELELGEESCERTSELSDATSCGVEFACGKPIQLDDATDARAWLMRFGSARCNRWQPNEAFSCDCADGTRRTSYALVAEGTDLGCGPLADLCMTHVTPALDDGEVCLSGSATADSEGCQRFARCGPQMVLTDDVSVVQLEQRVASCVPGSNGGSECSCSHHDSAFTFQLSTPPDDTSCESSIEYCDPDAVFEPLGRPSCEPLGPSTNEGDMCSAFLLCDQEATIGDRTIVAHARLGLLCRRLDQGMPWRCSCASGPETARFELGASGANADQACSQALSACLEQPGLHLGREGDSMPLPDPLL